MYLCSVLKTFKYRLYPTEEQVVLLNKHIGSVRFLYNLALETKQMAWLGNRVSLSRYDLQVQLKDLKNDLVWLKEVNSQSLQYALMNLDAAYLRFFKGQNSFPKFKKKSINGSFNIPQKVILVGNKLKIPKFKRGIKIILHRPIKGKIRQATISKSRTCKYFVSILCETGDRCLSKPKVAENGTVGVDLGIKNFAVTSDAEVYENPNFLRKAQSKLKYTHRKYSAHKGKRTRHRLAILHEKVANQRKDFLQKVSTMLIRENQSIALENLNVSGMLKNHNLAQSIADAGWTSFVTMLEYKAEWYGVNILKIGRFDPSSKLCSSCGTINKDLRLKDRKWTCGNCGTSHDRDINAACNIKSLALKNYVCGTQTKNQDELPTLVGVLTPETHKIAHSEDGVVHVPLPVK